MGLIARVYNVIAVASIATLLALLGWGGTLLATGRLTPARAETIARVLRGELDAAPAAESDATHDTAASPAPRSIAELREQRRREQMARAVSDRALRDLQAQRDLLAQASQHLIRESEKLDRSRGDWEAQRRKLQNQQSDAGFQEELKLVAKLAPNQAKEHLLMTWHKHPADAVRLVKALGPSRAQRILDQLKTEDEKQILHALLEQLRLQDIDQFVPKAGTPSRGNEGS